MKIELQKGTMVAVAETVADVEKLISLKDGNKQVGYPVKRKMTFKTKECGYCHKSYARLGKHTPFCTARLARINAPANQTI